MKPEVQCLLEYYTGENFFSVPECEAVCQGGPIENAENLERSSESEGYSAAIFKNKHAFVPECEAVSQGGGPIENAENLEGSSESEGYFAAIFKNKHDFVPQSLAVCQGADCDAVSQAVRLQNLVSNETPYLGIQGQLHAHQRERIRDISRNLRSLADSLHIRPAAHVAAEQVVQHENLDEREMQVINNIYSIRSLTTVSRIANYLEEKLTCRTLRAAFHFLCYSVSSIPEELAVVCELAKLTAPKIQQLARSDSTIYDVISEFVEERLPAMY